MNENYGARGIGKFSLFPPVIKSLIIINVTVFLLEHFVLGFYRVGDFSLRVFFEKFFYLIPLDWEGASFHIWQLLTYQFIHADIWHIFFNLFALWMFGIELETNWGTKKFLLFYLLSGIGAALVQLFIAPMFGPNAPTIGASGAIFGVLVAYGFSFPDRPIFMFPLFIPIKAKYFVMLYAGLEIFLGFSGSSSGVAHFAHLGGAITGFFLFKFGDSLGVFKLLNFLGKDKPRQSNNDGYGSFNQYNQEPKQARVYKTNWQGYEPPPVPVKEEQHSSAFFVNGEEVTQQKIDSILDKISASGYQNLNEKEKQILFELSQKIK